jgi:hypothetical protein
VYIKLGINILELKNVLELKPKGLEIEKIGFKLAPRKPQNIFYNVKIVTKGSFKNKTTQHWIEPSSKFKAHVTRLVN